MPDWRVFLTPDRRPSATHDSVWPEVGILRHEDQFSTWRDAERPMPPSLPAVTEASKQVGGSCLVGGAKSSFCLWQRSDVFADPSGGNSRRKLAVHHEPPGRQFFFRRHAGRIPVAAQRLDHGTGGLLGFPASAGRRISDTLQQRLGHGHRNCSRSRLHPRSPCRRSSLYTHWNFE